MAGLVFTIYVIWGKFHLSLLRLSFVSCKRGILTVLSAKIELDNKIKKAQCSIVNVSCYDDDDDDGAKQWVAEPRTLLEESYVARKGHAPRILCLLWGIQAKMLIPLKKYSPRIH